jgi:hypothetical protein
MPEIQIKTTVTTKTRKSVTIEPDDLEQLLIQHFGFPANTEVTFYVDTYGEDLRRVVLTYETSTTEEVDDA